MAGSRVYFNMSFPNITKEVAEEIVRSAEAIADGDTQSYSITFDSPIDINE